MEFINVNLDEVEGQYVYKQTEIFSQTMKNGLVNL